MYMGKLLAIDLRRVVGVELDLVNSGCDLGAGVGE